jgi:site-specific recombinase XerD
MSDDRSILIAPASILSELATLHDGPVYLPSLITGQGEKATRRFLEFFAATIRNKNTRLAYYRAVTKFFGWCEMRGVRELSQIEPMIVAAFIEEETNIHQAQTVKQELAAIRKLFDYLVTGQVLPHNPASSVRGPSYSIDEGKTPVLSREDARKLLESIPIYKDKKGKKTAANAATETERVPDLLGLRDRALIGLMVYSFARVSAVVNMKVSDYRQNGKRFQVQLHEKGGKFHKLPVHHKAEEYLDEYLAAADIGEEKKTPLFRSAKGRSGALTNEAMHRIDVFRMIKRRAKAAGVAIDIGCHTFRATGITAYLLGGGSIESAQQIAKHRSPRTTKLYDRRGDKVTLDEIERIVI